MRTRRPRLLMTVTLKTTTIDVDYVKEEFGSLFWTPVHRKCEIGYSVCLDLDVWRTLPGRLRSTGTWTTRGLGGNVTPENSGRE